MFKLQNLYDAINKLKRQGNFHTNCFFLYPKMKFLSEQPDSRLRIEEKCIVLLYRDRNFQRLYYCASGLSAIAEICNTARELNETNAPIVADVVGSAEYTYNVTRKFEEQKAQKYAVLSRYRASALRTVPEKKIHCECTLVSVEGVPQIIPLLKENLDPLVSHLPTLSYLYELQKKHLLYGCYVHGQLIGIECLEPIGVSGRYIYQLAIKKVEQNKGYATILNNYMISCNLQCKQWSVWIDDTNTGSIYVNEKFGLLKDGLKNMVVIL